MGRVIRMLLSLTVAVNASQAMVLCLGCDGHVAVEPAGHHHDDCGDHTHPHKGSEYSPISEGASCRGCVDIPLPSETSARDAANGFKVAAAAVAGAATAGMTPENARVPAAEAASELLVFYHVPLRSIVLQV